MNRKTLLLITVVAEGGLFLLGLLLLAGSDRGLWARFDLSWIATAYAISLCVPMFVALYLVARSRWEPLSRLGREIDEKITPIFTRCKIIDLALIAFFAGVGEELFFRGWMQAVLVERSGVVLGILITSAIFGLLHYLSMAYAIYAFITGIYLGLIYQVSGNLYIVMSIHAIYDFVALLYLFKKGKTRETGESNSGTAQQVE